MIKTLIMDKKNVPPFYPVILTPVSMDSCQSRVGCGSRIPRSAPGTTSTQYTPNLDRVAERRGVMIIFRPLAGARLLPLIRLRRIAAAVVVLVVVPMAI